MKRDILIIVAILCFGLNSCIDQQSPTVKKEGAVDISKDSNTAFGLDERLRGVDSVVLVFYKDPYGADSLRYTRYYTQTSLVSRFDTLITQLSLVYSQEPLRKCRTEGKIWCFTKGKVFQTLYFSTQAPSCAFLYLIKDGNFYYADINPGFDNWLKNGKTGAVELPNQALESN